MTESRSMPPEAAETTTRYLALAARERVALCGLYLVGSVALDDFLPGQSDVDFVAVLEHPASAAEIATLARVHAAMTAAGGPFFDGIYVTRDQLRAPPPLMSRAPFVVEGVFRPDGPCPELTPVVFDCLTQSGIRVLGPEVPALGVATDRAATKRYLHANLAGYWTSWAEAVEAALDAKTPADTVSAATMAWGVLGVARIAATLETGRIVSKTAAGLRLLASAEPPEDAVLRAIAARRGEIERLNLSQAREALDFIKATIAAARERRSP